MEGYVTKNIYLIGDSIRFGSIGGKGSPGYGIFVKERLNDIANVYAPNENFRFDHIKNGDLGEIYSINAEMSTFHSAPYKKWLKNFGGGIMYILGSHLVDLIIYIMGEPKKITTYLKRTGADNIDLEDNNLAVLEYDKALARIFVSSVEVNGWGRRQLMVSGSRGTVNIMPLENDCHMTYANTTNSTDPYKDMKETVDINDVPKNCRYDDMMKDFYAYIQGTKQNPFTYEHDYLVQKTLDEIVGGVRFNGKNID